MEREELDLAVRLEHMDALVQARRRGWYTRRYARHTARLFPDKAIAQVYACMVYLKAGRPYEAYCHTLNALECDDVTPMHEGRIHHDWALWYVRRGDLTKARSHLMDARNCHHHMPNHNLKIALDVLEGRIIQRQGEWCLAGVVFKSAEQDCRSVDNKANHQLWLSLRMQRLYNAILRGDRQLVRRILLDIKLDEEGHAWQYSLLVALRHAPWIARRWERWRSRKTRL